MKIMLVQNLERNHCIRVRTSYRQLRDKGFPPRTARRAMEVVYEAYLEVNLAVQA